MNEIERLKSIDVNGGYQKGPCRARKIKVAGRARAVVRDGPHRTTV